MRLQLNPIKHPKDGYTIRWDLVNVDEILKWRDKDRQEDCCTYEIWYKDILVYIGEGKYYDIMVEGKKKFLLSRPFMHKKDLVKKYVDEDWDIRITSYGVTKKEGQVLEAYFIRQALAEGRTLTKQGATTWDGYSLMNKNRGMSDANYSKSSSLYLR